MRNSDWRYIAQNLTLTCCQDHILTENIWFVCSETSYSGDERRCYRCGTNKRPITEDRASQPMEAGGWVSQCENNGKLSWFQAKEWKCGAAALPFIFGRTRQHWVEIFPDSATISSLNIIQHNQILHTTIQDNTVDNTTNCNRKGSPPPQAVQCFSTLFKLTLTPFPLVWTLCCKCFWAVYL